MSFFRKLFCKRKEKKVEKEKENDEFHDCVENTLEELLELRVQKRETLLNNNAEKVANWILRYLEHYRAEKRRQIALNCVGHVSVIWSLCTEIENSDYVCTSTKLSQRIRKVLFQQKEYVGKLLGLKEDVICKAHLNAVRSRTVNFDLYFIFKREMFRGNAQKSLPFHVFTLECFCQEDDPVQSDQCKRDEECGNCCNSQDDESSYDCGCIVNCKRCHK